MIIYIDIDDAICKGGTPEDYSTTKPKLDRIDKNK